MVDIASARLRAMTACLEDSIFGTNPAPLNLVTEMERFARTSQFLPQPGRPYNQLKFFSALSPPEAVGEEPSPSMNWPQINREQLWTVMQPVLKRSRKEVATVNPRLYLGGSTRP